MTLFFFLTLAWNEALSRDLLSGAVAINTEKSNWQTRVSAVLAIALIAVVCVYMMQNAKGVQWDFKVYFYAAQCFRMGLNPYDLATLTRVSGGEVILPYTYPPITLAFFVPFTLLPLKSALKLWMFLKLAMVMGSCALWMRWLSMRLSLPLALISLLGFNLAIVHDLASGNIAAMEQFLLIAAITSLGRQNHPGFVAALVICAQIKLIPILFAAAPIVIYGRKGIPVTAIAAGLWAAFFSLNLVLFPELSRSLFESLLGLDERGEINPSTVAALRDIFALAGAAGTAMPNIVYAAFAGAVAFVCLRNTMLPPENDRTRAMLLMLAGYALFVPRFKDYSYVLLLPPLAACLLSQGRPLLRTATAILALLPNLATLMGMKGPGRLVFDYQPWLAAILLFVFFLRQKPETKDGTVS